jgi:hypothetical protein
MTKRLRGVVFAEAEDDEYDGMAHVRVRDAETTYWFSLSRRADSDTIQVMVSDQLTYDGCDISVTLSASGIRTRLSSAAASKLDGHVEYFVEFHPDSQDIESIGAALKAIFRDKSGLRLIA